MISNRAARGKRNSPRLKIPLPHSHWCQELGRLGTSESAWILTLRKRLALDLCRLLCHKGNRWAVTSTFDRNKGILVDVFSREGQYLDNFYLPILKIRRDNPQYYAPMAVWENFLHLLEADEDDVISLIKYEIVGE